MFCGRQAIESQLFQMAHCWSDYRSNCCIVRDYSVDYIFMDFRALYKYFGFNTCLSNMLKTIFHVMFVVLSHTIDRFYYQMRTDQRAKLFNIRNMVFFSLLFWNDDEDGTILCWRALTERNLNRFWKKKVLMGKFRTARIMEMNTLTDWNGCIINTRTFH